jgi:hypothetical protein
MSGLTERVDDRTRNVGRGQRLGRLQQGSHHRVIACQRGIDDSGFDDRHSDTRVGHLLPEGVRETHLSPLARDVGRLPDVHLSSRDGRGDEDMAATTLEHVRKDGPHGVERTQQVRLDDRAPPGGIARMCGALIGDAGVGDKDVDPAEPVKRSLRELSDLLVVTHIRLECLGVATGGVHGRDDLVRSAGRAVTDDKATAEAGEGHGDCSADAAEAAGDDDDG